MIHIEVLLDKLKSIAKVSSDAEIARTLNMKPDALFQRQKRNSIPHDNVIKYCTNNKISLDMIYENINLEVKSEPEHETKSKEFSSYNIGNIKIYNSDEYISLPLNNTKSKKLNAYIDESSKIIYIIDTEIRNLENDGLYFISHKNRESVKNIQTTFKNTYSISDPTEQTSISFEINDDDMKTINLLGKVLHQISY